MSDSASLGVLLDHAQDKIALLDDHGEFIYVNSAVEGMLGYEPAGLVGTNTFDYIHPDAVETVREQFTETITSDEYTAGSLEYRFRAADDSWVWLESRMSNVTDESLDGYVVSSRDVTERVTAERECEQISTRLRELSATTGDVLWSIPSRPTRRRFSMRSIPTTCRRSATPWSVSRGAGRSNWSTA